MKPTMFRLSILVLATVVGVAASVFLSNRNVSDQLIPPIDNVPPTYPNSLRISIASNLTDRVKLFYQAPQQMI